MGIAIAASIAAGAAGACGGSIDSPDPADERQTVVELPATMNRDLDLLFVVDDSVGLIEIQQSLAASLPVLFDRLQRVPGGLPNLHVGVVTTDMGTQTSGSPTPAPAIGQIGAGGCAGTGKNGVLQTHVATMVNGTFLSDVAQTDGSRLTNYTGELATTVGLMMCGGAGGCGFEQPLAAMRAALGGQPANAGFLRPDALLGVVIVADEDDCSAASTNLFATTATGPLGALSSFRCTRFGVTCTIGGATPDAMNQPGPKGECRPSPNTMLLDDVATYRDFLLELKADPRQVIVGGIMGPVEPVEVALRNPPGGGTPEPALVHVCMDPGIVGPIADPAVRLHGLLGEFPDRSTFAPVCQQDLSGGVAKIGGLLARAIGSPCVDGVLADADPAAQGVQLDCIVEDLVGAAATKIDQCDASERAPCWKLEEDAASCVASGNLKLVVVRGGEPAPETVTRMRCKVAP